MRFFFNLCIINFDFDPVHMVTIRSTLLQPQSYTVEVNTAVPGRNRSQWMLLWHSEGLQY